ncbi:MAG: hypothetical protein ACKVS6_13440 [Planctomycetota bacterium]
MNIHIHAATLLLAGFMIFGFRSQTGAQPGSDLRAAEARGAAVGMYIPEPSLAEGNLLYVARGGEIVEVAKAVTKTGSERKLTIPRMDKITAIHPAGDLAFVTGGIPGKTGEVALVNLKDWKVESQPGEPLFTDLATSLDRAGSNIIVGSNDKTAKIIPLLQNSLPSSGLPQWDRCKELLGHTGSILSVSAGPRIIATGSYDRTIRIWNLESGELLRTLTNHAGPVNALSFTSGSKETPVWLVSGSDDKTVRVWDPSNGRLMRIIREHDGRILTLRIPQTLRIPETREATILSGASDGRVREITLDSGEVKIAAEFPGRWIYSIAAAAPNRIVAVGTDTGVEWIARK